MLPDCHFFIQTFRPFGRDVRAVIPQHIFIAEVAATIVKVGDGLTCNINSRGPPCVTVRDLRPSV